MSLFKSKALGDLPWAEFYPAFKAYSAAIISRADAAVACFESTPDEILGYALVENGTILHWAYVKYPYRGVGIGTSLIQGAAVTCLRPPSKHKGKLWHHLKWNPLLLATASS